MPRPDLAIYYEHPRWFEPLFAALDRHGVAWTKVAIQDHTFDPADPTPPAPVILNRLAMSSFLRQSEHALFYSALCDRARRGRDDLRSLPGRCVHER